MNEAAPARQRAFLSVERSLAGRMWISRLDQLGHNRALAMAQTHGVSELIGRVLSARGVAVEEAPGFLDPTIRSLMPDPSVLTDCDAAAERIVAALTAGKRIAIFGDYDVDGAASAALVARFCRIFESATEIYIPDRIFEGYGPNPTAIDELVDRGADLIVTVDCGSTSIEALERARERGVDVVVIDHHQLGAERPPCVALVNPNRQDDLSGLGHLCAAGVVFLVLVNVQRMLRMRGDPRAARIDLLGLLDLVALATVCDVVPLRGLNRAYVVKGLVVIRRMHNAGLAALARRAGITGPLTPHHLGFLLGPRINAGGRIGDAALGSRLLTLDDTNEAEAISQELDSLNKQRQALEAAMLAEAEAEAAAEATGAGAPSVIVTARDTWHPGIVGLLAARLKERMRKPAFAIAFDAQGRGSGSGRSVPGFDLGAMVRAAVAEGLLEKGGGHAMAAGITIERAKLGALRDFFERYSARTVAALDGDDTLAIDGALSASGASLTFIDEIERAGPYGSGHPQPIFALPAHRLADARPVGQNHVKVTLEGPDRARIGGIAFRSADTPLGQALLAGRGASFHFAGTLGADQWQGDRRVQIRLIDAAPVFGTG
ncbi:single-stranded-DNA-specific exonuclease RecJ [Pararhizobium mangrovi]|uniref:Single-stranded-DNA-specific exonuclease RecJ n=1 Tax=Pararhizobium mangrovi TaxID=2590452 RepID=A0A506TXY1_9HYPH|nr:single-stranded-DNA-specific exonuclease RecJ [Pararhizobium mangrovi]TPW26360.1 single-stranded-DNA-specific exonuclease RecJ [Pararhizobium mangrovi]